MTADQASYAFSGQPATFSVGGGGGGGGTASADWEARISDSGVVWYHNFESAAEVDQFRWTGGYAGGQDPGGIGNANANRCKWVPSGGPGGSGYLSIDRAAGTAESADWRRPFNALTGATNGRGVDDPGANGTVTPVAFTVTQGGNQLLNWAATSKPGWYGHSSYANSKFDGTDFYIQLRVRMDPARTTPGQFKNGKFVWLQTSNYTNPNQEIVTVSCFTSGSGNTTAVGQPNYHTGYFGHTNQGGSNGYWTQAAEPSGGTAIQLGSDLGGTCDPYNNVNTNCWSYATDGTWDTLLYHITPGTQNGTGANRTRMEVWAAHEGASSYTKIWDFVYSANFTNDVPAQDLNGWNVLDLSTYSNGFQGVPLAAFYSHFAQVIFSKAFIACPRPTPTWFNGSLNTWFSTPAKIQDAQTYAEPGIGTSALQGITAYSGAARIGTNVYVFGGGHEDSAQNAVISVDLAANTPAFSLLRTTTTTVRENQSHYADGRPTSRHSGWELQGISQRNRLFTFTGWALYRSGAASTTGVDAFNLATNDWDAAGTYASIGSVSGGVNQPAGVCQDLSGNVYHLSAGDGGIRKWTQSSATWSTIVGFVSANTYNTCMMYDPVRNRLVIFHATGTYIDLADNSVHTFTWGGSQAASIHTGSTACWCDDIDGFIYKNYGSSTILQVDPVTYAAETYSVSGTAPTEPSGGYNNCFGRFGYCKELGIVYYLAHYNTPLHAFRTRLNI